MRIFGTRLPVKRFSSIALAACLAGPTGAGAQVVGTAGAVNPTSRSIPPAGGVRVVQIGNSVVHRERIQTSAEGSVQLVFIDKTSISVGPNSDLVIDEFVFDPNAGTGRMAATLTKGVLRFVGGTTSHTGGATIKTPAATLGVRGGVATLRHVAEACGAGGSRAPCTQAINHFGRSTVATPAETQTITRPDFGVRVDLTGDATAPVRVPAAELASISAQLTSAPGQRGGAPRQPTPAAVAAAGVGAAQAALPTSTPSIQSNAAPAQARTTVAVLQQAPINETIQQGVQNQAVQETAEVAGPQPQPEPEPENPPPPGPIVGPPPPDPVVSPPPPDPVMSPPRRFYAMAMSIDPALRSGAPYLPAEFASSGTYYNSPVLGFGIGGTDHSGSAVTGSRLLQAGLNINGSGASQVSTIYLMTGGAYVSEITGQNVFNGGFAATTRRAANLSPGRASGSIVGLGSQVTFDASYSPLSAQLNQDDIGFNDERVSRTARYFPGGGVPASTYTFSQTATRITTPVELGTRRPEIHLSGFAAGLMQTYAPPRIVGPSFQFVGGIGLSFIGTNGRMSGVIGGGNENTTGAAGEFDSGVFYLGQYESNTFGRSAYIDYDNFGLRESATPTGSPSMVNDQAVTSHQALVVNSKTVNAESRFPGVTFCECEYTRWGFWSQEVVRPVSGGSYQDILHLGTWVAGLPTQDIDMPTTGTATYRGHVIASIKSNGSEYVAAGNFANAVNFNTGTGTVAVTNLDGRNYNGTVMHAPGSNLFAGSLTGASSNAATMDLLGQFFDNSAGKAREMGGFVTIDGGTSYLGAGTFAARTNGIAP